MAVETFPGILARFAIERPDLPALVEGDLTVTWSELDAITTRLAREFERQGVTAESLVSIVLPNGIPFFACTFAAWKLGATPMPLSARMPGRELDEVIALAAPELVIDQGADVSRAGRSYDQLMRAAASRSDDPLPERLPRRWKAITSGGSTGRPKVIISLEAAQADASLGIESFGLRPDSRQLLVGPVYHNGPFVCGVRGLMSGGVLYLPGQFDGATTLDAIERLRINWMQVVPTMMHRMLRADPDRTHTLESLDAILHLGAPCPPWVKQAWIDWVGPERVIELYGSTEAQATTIITGNEWLERPGSVGQPGRHPLDANAANSSFAPNVVVRDDENRDLPAGVTGELWCQVDPAKPDYQYLGAQPRRVGEWESVGDLGYLDSDGYLYIVDRRVDLIISGGANIYPAEVEAAILENPVVRDCVVIGIQDADLGRRVHALVELAGPISTAALEAFVKERIAPFKVPRSWEVVEELPRNEAGKIRKSAIAAQRLDDTTAGLDH